MGVDALLIWPRAGNTGDYLIADACERFLRDRGICVWRSDGSIEDAAICNDTAYLGDVLGTFRGMLMFSGGGNIGIYPDNAQMRSAVIAHARPHHRCLVFPQSAFALEPSLLDSRVTVWCRDAESEALLRKEGVRTALVPDAALYMDDRIAKSPRGNGTFYIRRTPGGDAETIDHKIDPGCPAVDLTLSRPLDEIIATLEPFEIVVSDRLHGGLISVMMRKKTIFLPVGYHKIRSFYETWLQGRPGVGFADSQQALSTTLSGLNTASGDYQAIFLEHADPALNQFLLSNA